MTKPLNESIRADLNKILESVDLKATPPKDDLNTAFGYEKRPRQLDEAVKPVAQVKVDTFLDWVYSDRDDLISLGDQVYKQLETTGKVTLTLDDVWAGLSYLPTSKIENFEELEPQLTAVQGIEQEEIVDPEQYLDVNWIK